MKAVRFPMYFEVVGMQEIPLPEYVDSTDENAVREYIADSWDHIHLPNEYDYCGDNGFDFESPIEIIDTDGGI